MNSESKTQPRKSITGLQFSRKASRSVMLADTVAKRLITLSGIGAIVAVSLVGLFLAWVVLPLFTPTGLDPIDGPAGVQAEGAATPALHQGLDDYGTLVWSLHAGGEIRVRDLARGRLLEKRVVDDRAAVTSWSVSGHVGRAVLGFADGSIRSLTISFKVDYLDDSDVPAHLTALAVGESDVWDRTVVERTPEHQLRRIGLDVTLDPVIQLADRPIVLLDVSATTNGLVVVALDDSGTLFDRRLTFRKNLLTGEVRVRSRGAELLPADSGLQADHLPTRMALNEAGDRVLLMADDGTTGMYYRGGQGVFEEEDRFDLVPEAGARLTAAAFLAGRVSLAVGDDTGRVRIWFPVRRDGRSEFHMQRVHDLGRFESAVTTLSGSGRSRLLAAGFADGRLRLFHVTSQRFLGETVLGDGPVSTVTIAPREDLVVAAGPGTEGRWALEAPHPDVSLSALIRPVWYEGYPGPSYVWQSSAATDTFEPKLSLMPLIFGTLKATFYSMLFGLPLALLAALYTSEFVPKGTRARIKPVIEIMASLPSVVLGFLAALVMAPFVEKWVVQILAVLLGGPFFVLVGAHLWQLLPREHAPRFDAWRPVAVLGFLLLGTWVAWNLAPGFEDLAFAGNPKAWLDGRVGSGVTGWFLLLLAPAALLTGWMNVTYGEGLLRSRGPRWSRFHLGLLDLGRFLVSTGIAAGLALFLGWLLNASGWDPRGSVLDTYVQRNALVVGFAMGFAVIPIIYSIAEDALSAVPDHLRAASLGAGATLWQTAIRVIVPPAMSGLFSAGMIGLGRAVGETMIVLMAAGNTPIMDMNIFNGFRTLSANLAVELPEAVQNSTHYRTLFLAALTLFVMTFILNTVAETVRLHFRGKSSRL